MRFKNRTLAGQELAQALSQHANQQDVILMALPRGGVPIGAEVAKALNLQLDVMLVRKLGVPGQEELAMGAITMDGPCVINAQILEHLHLSEQVVDQVLAKEQQELARRNHLYRADRPSPDFSGKTAIVIDDGLATGATMKAAVSAITKGGAARVVAAVPVGAEDVCEDLEPLVDEVVCLYRPYPFWSVGHWYENFEQVSDENVQHILQTT